MNESNKPAENTQTSLETAKNEPRESMVWYRSFFDAVETIKDINTKYQCYYAILCYGFFGDEPKTDNEIVSVLFASVKRNIDSNIRRYENCRKNGAKGGAPKGNQNARKNNQETTKGQPKNNLYENDNVNENVNDNVNENVNDNVNLVDKETLSQISTKFSLKFPFKNLHIKQVSEINKVNLQRINTDKLIKKINDSDFLLNNKNLGLEWCILNYERICAGEFDSFKQTSKNNSQSDNSFTAQLERAQKSLEDMEVIDI